MSRGLTASLGAVGALAGAYAGTGYLDDGAACSTIGQRMVECQLNQVILPFISAITVGAAFAIALGFIVKRIYASIHAEPPRPTASRVAVEVREDPFLQVASWGLAPGQDARPLEAVKLDSTSDPEPEDDPPTPSDPPKPTRAATSRTRRPSLGGRGRPVPTPRRG